MPNRPVGRNHPEGVLPHRSMWTLPNGTIDVDKMASGLAKIEDLEMQLGVLRTIEMDCRLVPGHFEKIHDALPRVTKKMESNGVARNKVGRAHDAIIEAARRGEIARLSSGGMSVPSCQLK